MVHRQVNFALAAIVVDAHSPARKHIPEMWRMKMLLMTNTRWKRTAKYSLLVIFVEFFAYGLSVPPSREWVEQGLFGGRRGSNL